MKNQKSLMPFLVLVVFFITTAAADEEPALNPAEIQKIDKLLEPFTFSQKEKNNAVIKKRLKENLETLLLKAVKDVGEEERTTVLNKFFEEHDLHENFKKETGYDTAFRGEGRIHNEDMYNVTRLSGRAQRSYMQNANAIVNRRISALGKRLQEGQITEEQFKSLFLGGGGVGEHILPVHLRKQPTTKTLFEQRLSDLQAGTTQTSIVDHIASLQENLKNQKLDIALQHLPEGVPSNILQQSAEDIYNNYIVTKKLTPQQLFQAIQRQKQADLGYVEEAERRIREIRQLDEIERTDPGRENKDLEKARKEYIAKFNQELARDEERTKVPKTRLKENIPSEILLRIPRVGRDSQTSRAYDTLASKNEEVERKKSERAAERKAKEAALDTLLRDRAKLYFKGETIDAADTLEKKQALLENVQSQYATLSNGPNFKALQKGTLEGVRDLELEKAKIPLFKLKGQRELEDHKAKLFETYAGLTGNDRETLQYDTTELRDDVAILDEVGEWISSRGVGFTAENVQQRREDLLAHSQGLKIKASDLRAQISDETDSVATTKLERQIALLDRRARLFEEAGSHLMNEDVAEGAQTAQEVNKEIGQETKALAQDKKESGDLMATLTLPEKTQQKRQKELLASREKRLTKETDPKGNVNKIDWAELCANEDNSSDFFNPELWQGMLGFAGAASYIVAQRRLYEKGSRDATFHATRALAVVGSSFLMDEPQDPAKTFMREPIDATIIPNEQLGQMFGVGGNPGTQQGFAQQALEPSQRLALAMKLKDMGYDMTNPDVQKFFGLATNGMMPQGTQNIIGFNPMTSGISQNQFGANQVLSPTQGKQGFGNFIRNISAMQQSANGYNQEMANNMPYRANNTFAEAIRSASRAQGVVAGFDTAASGVEGLEDRAGFATPDATGGTGAVALVDPLVAIQSADFQIQDKIQELLKQVYPVQLEYFKASEDLTIGPDGLMIGSYKPSEMRKSLSRRNIAYFQLIRLKTEIDQLQELRSMLPSSPDIAQRIMQGGIAFTSFLENIQEFLFFRTAFALPKPQSTYEKVLPYILNQDRAGLKKLLRNYTLVPNWRSILREEKKRISEMKAISAKQLELVQEELKKLMLYKNKDVHELSYREIKYEEMNLRAIAFQTDQNILLLKKMDEEIESKNWTELEKKKAHEDIETFRKLVLETASEARRAAQSFSDMHDFQLQFVLGLEERKMYESMAQEILK